jgi:hypothetical protein
MRLRGTPSWLDPFIKGQERGERSQPGGPSECAERYGGGTILNYTAAPEKIQSMASEPDQEQS